MIKEIESVNNKIVKDAFKLKNISEIKEKELFLIEGFHLIEMAKKDLVALFSKERLDGFENINQYLVSDEILKKLSSGKSFARVIGIARIAPEIDVNLITASEHDNFVYLDAIQDPGNLGTILRTCLAFDFKNIIVSNQCASIYNQKVIQASQGALFNLNIIKGSNLLLTKLKEKGFLIISTSLGKDAIFIDNFKINSGHFVIIFGNEGQGISKEILDISDVKLKINISNIDSLNVGVASGIVLYKLSGGK